MNGFMHNQDSTKDDLLETMMELLKEFQKYLMQQYKAIVKQREMQKNAEALENKMSNVLNGNEKDQHHDFKEAMKYIGENTSNPKLKEMAKLFHDNPEDGLALLQETNRQQGRESIIKVDQSAPVIISSLKKLEILNQNRETPNEHTAQVLKELINSEENNMQVAAASTIDLNKTFDMKGHKFSNKEISELADLVKESVQQRTTALDSKTKVDAKEESLSQFIPENGEEEQKQLGKQWRKRSNLTNNIYMNEKSENIIQYKLENGYNDDIKGLSLDEVSSSVMKEKELYKSEYDKLSQQEKVERDNWSLEKKAQIAVYLKLDNETGYVTSDEGIVQISERKFVVNQVSIHELSSDNPVDKKMHVIEFPEAKEVMIDGDNHIKPDELYSVSYSQFNGVNKEPIVSRNINQAYLSEISKYTSKEFEQNAKLKNEINSDLKLNNKNETQEKEQKKSRNNDLEMER